MLLAGGYTVNYTRKSMRRISNTYRISAAKSTRVVMNIIILYWKEETVSLLRLNKLFA